MTNLYEDDAKAFQAAILKCVAPQVTAATREETDRLGVKRIITRAVPHCVARAIRQCVKRQRDGRWYSGKWTSATAPITQEGIVA